ncbi:MAG: hypothetical protein EBS19_10540 [Spirochaetia bacterium]|nr:hypothetical protein [Spirochaetia bacterium]
MANVKKWGWNTQRIVFNPKEKNGIFWGLEGSHTILVDTAIMDSDIQCMHCGKTVKTGKSAFVFYDDRYVCFFPSSQGDKRWGNDSKKKTFCSSNHAKLFKKNTI